MTHYRDSTGKGYWSKEAKNDRDKAIPRTRKTDWDAVSGIKNESEEVEVSEEPKVKRGRRKNAE